MNNKLRTYSLVAVAVCAAAATLVWFWPRFTLSPEDALRAYEEAPEGEHAIDPLVLAGDRAVGPALRAVVDLRRGDRIGLIRFLGNGRYAEAEPVLARLVDRESEPGFLRCEALMALTRVNHAAGLKKAVKYKGHMGDLGYCATQIIAGVTPDQTRTYTQARLATLLP